MLQPKLTNFSEFVVKPKLKKPKSPLEIQKQTTNYLTIALVLIILLGCLSIYIRYKTKEQSKLESQKKLSQLNEYIQDHFIDDMILSQKNIQHTI